MLAAVKRPNIVARTKSPTKKHIVPLGTLSKRAKALADATTKPVKKHPVLPPHKKKRTRKPSRPYYEVPDEAAAYDTTSEPYEFVDPAVYTTPNIEPLQFSNASIDHVLNPDNTTFTYDDCFKEKLAETITNEQYKFCLDELDKRGAVAEIEDGVLDRGNDTRHNSENYTYNDSDKDKPESKENDASYGDEPKTEPKKRNKVTKISRNSGRGDSYFDSNSGGHRNIFADWGNDDYFYRRKNRFLDNLLVLI